MTPEQIAAGAACYQCLNEDQKRAAVLYLLDQVASGGSGGSGLFVLKAGDTMTGRLVSPNINYTAQGSTPTAPASGFVEFADSTGRKSWIRGSDGFVRTWDSTLTANRVFSLPDATTTIAGLAVAQTFTLANTFSANGAVSAPAFSVTGTPFSGGTATTTKPLFLIETSGATSTAWNTTGTMLGLNAPSGFVGDLVQIQLNGSTRVAISASGSLTTAANITSGNNVSVVSTGQLNWSGGRGVITSPGSGQIQFGAVDAAAPVAQTLSTQSTVGGTSNTAGATYTRITSLGTGTGGGGDDVLKMALTGASGTAQNTAGTRMYRRAKETTLTEATATKLFTVPLAAGSYIGMTITATVFASDGTDFQTLTSTLNVNAVAKSTTITGSITQVDGTVATSSGTLTPVTYTVVDDGSNVLSVKCAATSSLAQTTLSCKWSITMINSNASATITPL